MVLSRFSGGLVRDLRQGVRELRRNPGFALVAVFSLALGIGAATAIFSAIYAVLVDPFPYANVDSLMSPKVVDPDRPNYRVYYSTDEFLEIAARSHIFEGLIASTISNVVMTGDGAPERLRGNYGTFNTFQVMGVNPLLGRAPTNDDARPGAPPVTVLSYKFWQRRFGGDPGVLGRALVLNDVSRTVIGVMPPRFLWRGADVYLPIALLRGQAVEGVRMVHALGRVKRGVTQAQAEADLLPIFKDVAHRFPGQYPRHFTAGLVSFKEEFSSSLSQTLWLLFGAVGLLLLIACGNVANLLLARATGREREVAIRSSLGATRARLARQFLTESLLLAFIGGALGVGLAYAGLRALVALIPPDTIPDEAVVSINGHVLVFTVVLAAVTALLFGLAPALHSARLDLIEPLRTSGKGASSGSGRLRGALVALELALSVVLLVGASLMMRTVFALEHVDLGFQPDRLLAVQVPLPELRYPKPDDRVRFFMELTRRIESLPGVSAAGVNTSIPPFGDRRTGVEIIGENRPEPAQVLIHSSGSDYLRALGSAILRGRSFNRQEVAAKRPVAVVNATFVRLFLATGNPIGRLVRAAALSRPPVNAPHDTFEIVGVVRDVPNNDIRRSVLPEIYVPFSITGDTGVLTVRAQRDPERLLNGIRAEVYRLDKDQPVGRAELVRKLIDDYTYAQPRFSLVLFGIFAGIGLLLAGAGVYSLLSYMVSRQTHEIGIRMALGAQRPEILRMVLRSGLRLVTAGLAVGIAISAVATRLMAHHIWGVAALDPVSFAIVPIVLLAAGLAACYLPALRATRVDPMEALRYE
jgi:predicted permease